MSILKKKEEKKPATKKKATTKTETPKKEVKEVKTPRKVTKIASIVLHSPHIAEKPSFLMENGQYVFKVFKSATKNEIKKAVHELYNVDVIKVQVINIPRKKKRVGRTVGYKSGYKKAIVRLKKGQELEIMPR